MKFSIEIQNNTIFLLNLKIIERRCLISSLSKLVQHLNYKHRELYERVGYQRNRT